MPAFTPRLVEAVASAFGVEALVVGPGVRTGVKIRTDQPSELGADLVCAAAAAFELLRGPCIVVDFGLTLTFSAVNASGEFLGVAIAPGIAAAAEALRASAAQLPEVRLDFPQNAIGRSTTSAIQSGILLGYEGLVQALVRRISEELLADAGGSPSGIGTEVIGCGDPMGAAFSPPAATSASCPNWSSKVCRSSPRGPHGGEVRASREDGEIGRLQEGEFHAEAARHMRKLSGR